MNDDDLTRHDDTRPLTPPEAPATGADALTGDVREAPAADPPAGAATVTDVAAEGGTSDAEPDGSGPSAPRTRWAAIVWGLFFGALAYAGIWMLSDDGRRAGIVDGVMALTPGIIVAVALLAVGVLVLVAGIAGLIRHAQRRLAR